MFLINGANGAESESTFCRVRQAAAPTSKSAVYHCLVL